LLRRLISGRWLFSRQGAGIFLGLVGGDDDAAFEEEVDAVADNIHAGEIFRVPASMSIYHGPDLTSTSFPLGELTQIKCYREHN
jgi:hypothetical protein